MAEESGASYSGAEFEGAFVDEESPMPATGPMRGGISRRSMLAAAASTAMTAGATGPARAATARPKGPPVWLDMDQAELDTAYDQAVYAPNRDQIVACYAAMSEAV